MKSITVKYRPITFLPLYRTVTGAFPENWGEISAKQLIAIARLYKNHTTDVEFLSAMSGIGKHIFNRCDDYERFKLMEYLEFVGDHKAYHEFIISELHAPHSMPQAPCSTLHAPSPKLKGITFGQFIFADTYFSNYQDSQKEEDLNKFIAALYLLKDEKFDEQCIQKRHAAVGKIDRTTREAIAINWQLIHEWLSLAYPLIFQKREELTGNPEPETRNPEPVTRDSSVWIKIFQNFVGDDILHNDDWANQPINTIFTYMTRKYKENARRKN